MTRIVVIPDTQVPFQDKRFVSALRKYVHATQPDELFHVGDEIDSPETSRWAKGSAGEYAGTLQKAFNETTALMAGFRAAHGDKPFHVSRSNHADRTETYIRRYAPALASITDLRLEMMLNYPQLGITYHRQPYEFAPGWVLCHGDEGSLNQTPGGTALGIAKAFGKSVVCGHTHRAGIQPWTQSISGSVTRTLFGVEVGHAMNLKDAHYLKGGKANWQKAFGILNVEGKIVSPTLVYAREDGSFVCPEGKLWKP